MAWAFGHTGSPPSIQLRASFRTFQARYRTRGAMRVQSAPMKTNVLLRTLDTLLLTCIVSLIMHATSAGTVEVPLAPGPSQDA